MAKRKTSPLANLPTEDMPPEPRRIKGQNDTVALTFRVSHDTWRQLHMLANHDGSSIQHILEKAVYLYKQKHGISEF